MLAEQRFRCSRTEHIGLEGMLLIVKRFQLGCCQFFNFAKDLLPLRTGVHRDIDSGGLTVSRDQRPAKSGVVQNRRAYGLSLFGGQYFGADWRSYLESAI